MRPIRLRRSPPSLLLALALAAGASGACSSSSSNPPHDAGGGSGGTGGTGGTGGAGGGAGGSAGSGQDAAPPADAQSFDVVSPDSPASLTLTSTALAAGAAFAATNTCAGVNTSPPLTWTAGPGGTMSYAIILTDLSIATVHWVIWDIPAATTSLPAALPNDATLTTPVAAKQAHRIQFFQNVDAGYRGPCPNGNTHTYQFEVNAIGSATLAGVTVGTSTADDVTAAVQAASLAHGDLRGTSNAMRPPADAGGQ